MGRLNAIVWTIVIGSICGLWVCSAGINGQEAPATIRSEAVLDLSFEEEAGEFVDAAEKGTVRDSGQAVNNPGRVASPFFGQRGKRALSLNGINQYVQIADSADLDQAQALSLSFFYQNLIPEENTAAHGIVAKRKDVAGNTNFGINFVPKTNIFQVYFNDGSGFRVATYGVGEVLGYRRHVFLTATLEVGDAPEPDVDTDADDVRIHLYVNGKRAVPKSATNGFVKDQDAWLPDVNPTALANDVPLTIGSSTPTIEFASGIIDELTLIPRALNADEAKRLFAEIAGPQGELLTLPEPPAAPPAPVLNAVSLHGLQIGGTTRLVVTGSNLGGDPEVTLPIRGADVGFANAGPNRMDLAVKLPAEAVPGVYPLQIRTSAGVSNVIPLVADHLPQFALQTSTPEQPFKMPCAVTGTVAGGNQAKVYVSGKKGETIVVDLECTRLGAAMTPVLEWKSSQGTPLAIQWGQVEFNGDPRIVATLPEDGVYFAEVHDLAYRAPGGSPFRVKIGQIPLIDTTLPPAVRPGVTGELRLVGNAVTDGRSAEFPMDAAAIPSTFRMPSTANLPAPVTGILVSDGIEVVEELPPAEIEAMFLDAKPIYLNGRISERKEIDIFPLKVKPGMKLKLQVFTRSISSPVDPKVTILHGDNGGQLAALPLDPVGHEPSLEFTVPQNLERIQIAVQDNLKHAGRHHLYRIRVASPTDVDFELKLSADRMQIAADGSGFLELNVVRRGENGEIRLAVPGQEAVDISPSLIPAGVNKTWVTLTVRPGASIASIPQQIQIIGTSAIHPAVVRAASVAFDARRQLLAAWSHQLSLGVIPANGVTLNRGDVPVALFRGTEALVPVRGTFAENARVKSVRLSLLSTETPRPVDPKDANKGMKPTVDAFANQSVDAESPEGFLRIAVPLDVAENSIDFVIRGELVLHPFAANVVGTLATAPFRLPVMNAVNIQLPVNNLSLTSGTPLKFAGTLQRTAGFTSEVTVQLQGFPAGYEAPAVVVPADQSSFELSVTAPAVANVVDVPNIVLKVTADGSPLIADIAVPTKVTPAAQ